MVDLTSKPMSEYDRIRKNIEGAAQYFLENSRNFHRFKEFIYKSNLSKGEANDLAKLDRPELQFNVLETYVSRLKGEWSKQEPSIQVRAVNENVMPLLVEVVQGHISYLMKESNTDKFLTRTYDDTLSGGFSVLEVWTEYENRKSIHQKLCVGKLPDPTLAVFDPLARLSHKGDGKFCVKFYPILTEDFTKKWPDIKLSEISSLDSIGDGFRWYYEANNKKIILIADYYEKVEKKVEIVLLSDGQTMATSEYNKMVQDWQQFSQPPAIVKRRVSTYNDIMRYKIVGNKILEKPEKTDFEELPLIFVDGNSTMIKDNGNAMTRQFTRPYFYQAIDAQRFKNYAGQTLASEIANLVSAKFLVEANSIRPQDVKYWANSAKMVALMYMSRDEKGNELPPPVAVPRSPIPPEIMAAFDGADRTIQNILGSYDAALGKTEKELSGIALIESATQSNATAMPYVYNFMAALQQVGRILLSLIPKYYTTPRSMPILAPDGSRAYVEINKPVQDLPTLMMDFDPDDLELTVEATANFRVQQNKDLETLINVSSANPQFGAFMAQQGLPFILDNLDIKGIDELTQKAKEWMVEQQNQPPQPDPQAQMAQADMQLRQQKQQQDYQLKMMQLQQKEKELEEARYRLILDASQSAAGHQVQLTKAETEKQAKAAELAMKEVELAAKREELQYRKGETNER